MKQLMGIATILVGIISGILFFKAGSALDKEGRELTTLRSVGGTSVAESYYQAEGEFRIAYGTVSYALGLGVIALSLGLGGTLLFTGNRGGDSEPQLGGRNTLVPCPNCKNPCSVEAVVCPKCLSAVGKNKDDNYSLKLNL